MLPLAWRESEPGEDTRSPRGRQWGGQMQKSHGPSGASSPWTLRGTCGRAVRGGLTQTGKSSTHRVALTHELRRDPGWADSWPRGEALGIRGDSGSGGDGHSPRGPSPPCPGAPPGDPSCRESVKRGGPWPWPRAPVGSVLPAQGPGLQAVLFQPRPAPRQALPLRLGAEPSALPAPGCRGGATQGKGRPREQLEGGGGRHGHRREGAGRGRAGSSPGRGAGSAGTENPALLASLKSPQVLALDLRLGL